MTHAFPQMISDGHGGLVAPASLPHLAVGTMVSHDLDAARRLYEDFLGFEAVRVSESRMFLRDRRAKHLMEQGERDFFVIQVDQVEAVEKPQKMLNHWGIAVGTQDEVRRIYDLVKAEKENWYIKKMRPITGLHESYGFFFIDVDDNWWEIENRGTMTNDGLFAKGDYDKPNKDVQTMVDPKLDIAKTASAVVGDEAFMTHGTVDAADILKARHFYEHVLGLRSVLRSDMAQFTAGGSDFAFVGVQVGEKHVASQSAANRWILLVDDEDQLRARHERALGLKDECGLRQISNIAEGDAGERFFQIENADSNWFEFSTRSRQDYVDVFKQLAAA